jgi:hypothetical protein
MDILENEQRLKLSTSNIIALTAVLHVYRRLHKYQVYTNRI